MFERLEWQDDHFMIDELVFYLKRPDHLAADRDRDWFVLDKPTRLLDQYRALWPRISANAIQNLLELGIYDGGSIVFWFELLAPVKYVALDLAPWGDIDYFRRYLESRNLGSRIKTYWQTDQGDREGLRTICQDEFDGPLDLVVDDASHLYAPTRASFETLFPLLRPGGLFIIEDWSWGCWPNLPKLSHPDGTELPQLVHQLTDAAGSMQRFLKQGVPGESHLWALQPLIASVTVYPDIVVVERGPAEASEVVDFDLESYITRRPRSGLATSLFLKNYKSFGRFLMQSLPWLLKKPLK